MLNQRFTNFDDTPETFHIWKASFQSTVKDLNTSHAEEFDLLIKYLGPESKKYAVSLRTSNASNVHKGLERLWEKLYEKYGRPDMIESSLKRKTNFKVNKQRQ